MQFDGACGRSITRARQVSRVNGVRSRLLGLPHPHVNSVYRTSGAPQGQRNRTNAFAAMTRERAEALL